MVDQVYNIYTSRGFAGDLDDSAPRVVQTGLVEAATLAFGVGVKPGTAGTQVLAGSKAGNVFAITQRELNHESATRPSDGFSQYVLEESVSLIREGFILVEVTERAVTRDTKLNVNDTTGAFSGGTAIAGETACLNVTATEAGQVGDLVKARIDIVH